MGKASIRKQKRCAEWLADLAIRDPKRFLNEIEARLDSWDLEIRARAKSLDKSKPVFEVVEIAVKSMPNVGETLTVCCCSALARNNSRTGRERHIA